MECVSGHFLKASNLWVKEEGGHEELGVRVVEEERDTALTCVQGWQAEAAVAGRDLWFRALRLTSVEAILRESSVGYIALEAKPCLSRNLMSWPRLRIQWCWRDDAEVSEDLECCATQKLC